MPRSIVQQLQTLQAYMRTALVAMLLLRSSAALQAALRAGRRGLARAAKKAPKEDDAAAAAPVINWYPGHIARAERELRGYLKRVDVVVEARDARIGRSTAHPDLADWVGDRPRVVVFTFADLAPPKVLSDWRNAFDEDVFFVDARRGGDKEFRGVRGALQKCGRAVNEKRKTKGIAPRSARVAVVGYPNVGKSALINRLAGRKAAKSEDRAGVTRSLGWVRSKSNDGRPPPFELLDSPGIIPAKQNDPRQAARLAMCGRIGQASYDERRVAEALLAELRSSSYAPGAAKKIQEKYGLDLEMDPDLFLADLAEARYDGDDARAAVAVLGDFRSGRLGNVALEGPPPREVVEEPVVVEAAPPEKPVPESDFDRRMSEGDFAGW